MKIPDHHISLLLAQPGGWLGVRRRKRTPGRPLQVAGDQEGVLVADAALVDEGAVVGHLDRLADAGLAALHDAQLVGRLVQAQGGQLAAREPLPGGGRFVSM